ncbi:hypothetical protein C9J01_18995 [Photobacterium rosenbergii]|uniref:Uncharacterized protein n=1 Tax=Photobacterium rosenbergii TaxID=294936 RepID=A0A2T3N9U9_9GAMM|nr:hypothetical protein [Photobacterium rosenbergii]PSW10298.1 hypothetical protein C9J01_18995 [Photobacterium rosenbergii]
MCRSRYCQRAYKEAKGYDRVSNKLLSLLKLPIHKDDNVAIVNRYVKLINIFLSTSKVEANNLFKVITNLNNSLGRLFKCELSTSARNQLIDILKAKKNIETKNNFKPDFHKNKLPVILYYGAENPLLNPRYIDNVVTSISYTIVLKSWTLIWRGNGILHEEEIANYELSETKGYVMLVTQKIFESKEEALSEVTKIKFINENSNDGYNPQVITFYKGRGGIIVPSRYTDISTPRIFSGMKNYLNDGYTLDTADSLIKLLKNTKDVINPLPFDIDENGEINGVRPSRFPKIPKNNGGNRLSGVERLIRSKVKFTLRSILNKINKKIIWTTKKKQPIYRTDSDLIIGSYEALNKYRVSKHANGALKGWHAHHIIEQRHLDRLGISDMFPAKADLPCVFLPSRAHSQRISGFLTSELGTKRVITDIDVVVAYSKAYKLLGDFTGMGASVIQLELKTIVRTMLGFD